MAAMTTQQQEAAHARTLASYCQHCGALPGEKCSTKTGRPHQRRKEQARELMRAVRVDPRADESR